jgi:hypothetical protein
MTDQSTEEVPATPTWRIRLGTWMFAVPFVMFVGAPVVVPFLGLSGSEAAAVIGGIVVAAEVVWFASIPLLGKQGFLEMKKKSFGFLKLPEGPVSQARHKLGVRLFWAGLGGQLGLHAVMVIAIAIVGGHPEKSVLGLNFDEQIITYLSLLMLFTVLLVAGVYALGEGFAERFKHVFDWPGKGDVAS